MFFIEPINTYRLIRDRTKFYFRSKSTTQHEGWRGVEGVWKTSEDSRGIYRNKLRGENLKYLNMAYTTV